MIRSSFCKLSIKTCNKMVNQRSALAKKCNGYRICYYNGASSSLKEDPCPGVEKYTAIRYHCVPSKNHIA